jgi:glycosyltransferase involved in cell wall biosynthesis
MRVGFDGRSLGSPAGGVRRYASELLLAFGRVAPDLQLTVLGAPDGVSLPPAARRQAVARLAPTNLGWSLVDLPRAVQRLRFDLFHAPAYTAPLRAVHPLVLTIHDVSYERHPEWYPYRRDGLRRWFYRRCALAADCILTDSEFSRAEIQAAYGIQTERIRVVPLGVGAPFIESPAVRSQSADVREPYLLHVGDLHPRRNLRLLVRAAGRISRRDPLLLVLAGKDAGEHPALLQEAGKAGVTIRFTTPENDTELAQLYAGASAFVYPSRYEGFGLPLLEAMACGAPIVAARAASIPEVVGDAGILFEPTDEEDLVAGIRRILNEPALAAGLGQAGRARAAEFTWERTARATLDVYRRLIRDG